MLCDAHTAWLEQVVRGDVIRTDPHTEMTCKGANPCNTGFCEGLAKMKP